MNRAAHVALGLASPLMLASLLAGGVWGERTFVVLAVLFPAALCALGAGRRGRIFVGALGVVLLATGIALVVRGGSPGATASGYGLARGIAILVAGFALVPLLITGAGFAADRPRPVDASGDPRSANDSAGEP
jgi:hypothetical protein